MPTAVPTDSVQRSKQTRKHRDGRRVMRSALDRYKRHAVLFGPAEVFESARDDLTPRQLAQLASFLRDLDPYHVRDSHGRLVIDGDWSKFTLRRKQRDRLIESLIEAGEGDSWIADKLGVGRGTVGQVREAGAEGTKYASKTLQPRAARNSNGLPKGIARCGHCGALFAQPTGRGRPKKFCSDEHRRAHQNELRRLDSPMVRTEVLA